MKRYARHRETKRERTQIQRRIIAAYDNAIVRLYCTIRFLIINIRILQELEQYMPKAGVTIDLGCGFGLFSLYFASSSPTRRMVSLDLSERRIAMAQRAAEKLGLQEQTNFRCMNVLDYPFDQHADAIVILDMLHHLPVGEVPRILEQCHRVLREGGILLIKDVDAYPVHKRWFTWWLDKAMDPKTPVNYYSNEEMTEMLEQRGFAVKMHQMVDILPYPHVFYICTKVSGSVPG